MATCCTNVVAGGWSFFLTLPSDSTPQPSPSSTLFRGHCTGVSQRRSWASSISQQRPGWTKESRVPRRRRSWSQQRLPRTESPSACLATNVSSTDATSTEPSVVEGNGGGMSIEERDAILAFEGLSQNETAEERNSKEFQQLSSKQEPEGSQGAEQSEDVTNLRSQAETYETASKAVKGQGATIANIVTLFMTLLDSSSPGNGKIIACAGSAVLERVEEEVGKLRAVEGVDGQSLFEILRLAKLLKMDVQLIAAARKNSTMSERLVQAKAHCRQLLHILSTLSR